MKPYFTCIILITLNSLPTLTKVNCMLFSLVLFSQCRVRLESNYKSRRLETSRESELTTDIHTVVNNVFTHFGADELTKKVLPKNMSSIASSYFESPV